MSPAVLSLFLLTSAVADAAVPAKPEAIDPGSWFTMEDYPLPALRDEAEGTVGFEVEVDAEGKPVGCVVTEPSGNDSLDSVTCAILLREARFQPANNGAGKPVSSFYRSNVAWRLTESMLDDSTEDYSVVTLDFPGNGNPPQCRVEPEHIDHRERDWLCAKARGSATPELTRSFKQITILSVVISDGSAPPAVAPEWGTLLARHTTKQTALESGHLVRCISLSTEGLAGPDACAGVRDERSFTAAELAAGRTVIVERSWFGVPRE